MRSAPRGARSDGEDAAFLASAYGLTPDDWQEDILDDWLMRRRDGRWAASTCGLAVPRQNGKNGVIEVRELYGMVGRGEKFLHTAHEVKTARKAFLRIASFFEDERRYPELAALVREIRKTNGQEAVVLSNGGSVEFIARSKGSGRGFTVDVLVLDEAQDLKDDELEALLPTISAAPQRNPQVILTGTPPDPDKGQSGEVFARIRREASSDPRLSWTDFGVADGPMPDIDDRELWRRCNPALDGRLNIGEVERERRLMSDDGFARERLGWWGDPTASSETVLPMWGACLVDESEPPIDGLTIGLAVSIDQDWASLGAAALRDDNRVHLGATSAPDGTTDRRRGVAWVVPRLVEMASRSDFAVVIDGKGPASSLLPDLQAAGLSVVVANTEDVVTWCANLLTATAERSVTHFGDPELNTAVRNAVKRMVGDRWAWGRKRGDVSMLEAVTLAFGHVSNRRSVYETRGLVTL